jgi:hypothetical protein
VRVACSAIQEAASAVQAAASPLPCARPRLWGPWAKTWTVCGTWWAASAAHQAGKVSPGREADQPDPLGTAVSQPVNLSLKSVQRLGVPYQQRVVEHAGSDTEPVQPAYDRIALVGCMCGVAPAGQHDHVCRRNARLAAPAVGVASRAHPPDLPVRWASIQELVSRR